MEKVVWLHEYRTKKPPQNQNLILFHRSLIALNRHALFLNESDVKRIWQSVIKSDSFWRLSMNQATELLRQIVDDIYQIKFSTS